MLFQNSDGKLDLQLKVENLVMFANKKLPTRQFFLKYHIKVHNAWNNRLILQDNFELIAHNIHGNKGFSTDFINKLEKI